MKTSILIVILFCGSCGNKGNTEPARIEIFSDAYPDETVVNEPNSSQIILGKVVHVSDGDTLIIEDSTGYKTVIRLSGIDAPESDQSYGDVAKKTLESLVAKRAVIVETNKNDQYGRTVGKVIIGKRDICFEMIWSGMAWHFKRYEEEQPEIDRRLYAQNELQARKARKGLWRERNPIPPWDYRDAERLKDERPASNVNNQQNH